MRLFTLVSLASGLAVGYVLGAAAGQPRFDQIKHGAIVLMRQPKVEEAVFGLASRVEASSNRLPPAAGDLLGAAASTVQDKLTQPADDSH